MIAGALTVLALAAFAAEPVQVRDLNIATPLDGVWMHQQGDDPAWAAPGFDDSQWTPLAVPGPGHRISPGYHWCRFRVRLPGGDGAIPQRPLAISVPPIAISYELFVNGSKAGSFGAAPGSREGLLRPVVRTFEFQPAGRDLLIAIRCWWPVPSLVIFAQPDFAASAAWIGTPAALAGRLAQREKEQLVRRIPLVSMTAATMMTVLFFLLLPVWRRDAGEYLYLGVFLFFGLLNRLVQFWPEVFLPSVQAALAIYPALLYPMAYAWLGFLEILFQTRIRHGRTAVLACAILLPVAGWLFWQFQPDLLPAWFSVLLTSYVAGIIAITWMTRRASQSRQLALDLVLLVYIATIVTTWVGLQIPGMQILSGSGLWIDPRTASLLLLALSMSVLLNQRSARVQAEQQRLQQELSAAGEVQRLLLTDARCDSSLSFDVDPVYLPASEVGGDFFYIRPLRNGGLLVLAGDVSGKGLRAAMLVSSITGALRQIPESASPAAVLTALNQSLASQMSKAFGFVTCCAMQFDRDSGTAIIANAGHPSPYCDGCEIHVEPGLPLGISTDVTYVETSVPAPPAARFLLVSDGVVEAAKADGELFGFDRTREISTRSASEIAEAARAWGQNDDITVVTVRRLVD